MITRKLVKFLERCQVHRNPLVAKCVRSEIDAENFLNRNQFLQTLITYNNDNRLLDMEYWVVLYTGRYSDSQYVPPLKKGILPLLLPFLPNKSTTVIGGVL